MFLTNNEPDGRMIFVLLYLENDLNKPMHSTILPILPLSGTAVLKDGDFSLTDNLDQLSFATLQGQAEELAKRFPMKSALCMMLIVVEGRVGMKAGFSDCELVAGSCVILMPGTMIDRVAVNENARLIEISFPLTGGAFAQQVSQYQLLQRHCDMLVKVYGLMRQAITDSAMAGGRHAVLARCIDLMVSILENGKEKCDGMVKRTRGDEIVSMFMQCVVDNYREHRELSFYANQLQLSLKYMSQVVYGLTGRHPSQWIKDYVIHDAKEMLRSGNYSVQQVADVLHFPNQSFFGKYFKEAVGVSPKKWK